MPTREEKIRERAHQIWEQEGRPAGQEAQHWERASREIDAADADSAGIGHPPRVHEAQATSPASPQQTHPDAVSRGRKAPRRPGGKAGGKTRKS
ncbi:DUF2934 domain-containing protein [Vineibacter terrae]|uniref:DUF2934 domain-containing protein n=1 Tax=Vineibacter terrae TaxID=2586908 RepID=UPI002E350F88|nr:DUF2934 domain-containing protein [Vineibacter terrae]HEX2889564.1 DUF2934 domain-containing protein [Vineibacter terrae]